VKNISNMSSRFPTLYSTKEVNHTERSSSVRLSCLNLQVWNSMFFAFSLIIEGTTEKVFQIIMSLKSTCSRNFGFIEQKNVFLNTTESFK
jgi:hypothetical protein